MDQLFKYPRTRHIDGSGLQAGDEDLDRVPFGDLADRYLVVEEKMDGANSAVSFADEGRLLLQSRGHYLTGGEREKHFALLKAWAGCHQTALWELLRDRFVMYGEWLYAKHTVFYTDLPHYFLEFDIYDKVAGGFLSTARRQAMLELAPFVSSVKVLYSGLVSHLPALTRLIGPSHFIVADHMSRLDELSRERGLDPLQVRRETDNSVLMEGLYIKVEEGGIVQDRYKYVRPDFLQTVIASDSHWLDRPIIPNQLRSGAVLF